MEIRKFDKRKPDQYNQLVFAFYLTCIKNIDNIIARYTKIINTDISYFDAEHFANFVNNNLFSQKSQVNAAELQKSKNDKEKYVNDIIDYQKARKYLIDQAVDNVCIDKDKLNAFLNLNDEGAAKMSELEKVMFDEAWNNITRWVDVYLMFWDNEISFKLLKKHLVFFTLLKQKKKDGDLKTIRRFTSILITRYCKKDSLFLDRMFVKYGFKLHLSKRKKNNLMRFLKNMNQY